MAGSSGRWEMDILHPKMMHLPIQISSTAQIALCLQRTPFWIADFNQMASESYFLLNLILINHVAKGGLKWPLFLIFSPQSGCS